MRARAVVVVPLLVTAQQGAGLPQKPAYLDPSAPLETRVDDLIGRLTLAEKISLLGTTAPAIERLKVPVMNGWNQSLHGIVWTRPTTMFPVPISMAATWNPELVREVAAAIADAVLPFGVPILGMAFTAHEKAYQDKGIEFVPEFYADLEYDGEGNLILSRVHDAVDPAQAASRVLRMMRDQAVTTTTGRDIPVKATTVCVHSDTPSAVSIAAELARVLRQTTVRK